MTIRLLVCGALLIAAAVAPTATAATFEANALEAGFKLRGSHGYTISVVAFAKEGGSGGLIELTATRRHESASYEAPARLTADTISADLGGIGRVDLDRRPSGREKTVHPRCLGGRLAYEPATYEGVVEFNGEHGYTQARAGRVAWLPALLLFSAGDGGPCGSGYGEATGTGEPGARLRGVSFAHGRNLSFQVNKNSPKAQTVFTASLKERRGGIRIERELSGEAPAGAFRFDRQLRTAVLSPPSPFSGRASLTRSENAFSPIWTGNLMLDFPGQTVPMAGPEVNVSLVHARFTRSSGPGVEIGI